MAVIFSKIKAKNAAIARVKASIFNEEIWKKNNISLSYLSGQSTIISFFTHPRPISLKGKGDTRGYN
jgi:hypothetical protein